MGVILVVAAIVLFAAAYNSNLPYLGTSLEADLKGSFKWLVAMAAIGAIGLIPGSSGRRISNALFALVIIVILVKNPNIFSNIKSGSAFSPVTPPSNTAPGAVPQASTAAQGVTMTGQVQTGTNNTTGTLVPGGATLPNLGTGNVIPFPNIQGLGTGASAGNPNVSIENLTITPDTGTTSPIGG